MGDPKLVSELSDVLFAAFEPWNNDVAVMLDFACVEGRQFDKMAQAALDFLGTHSATAEEVTREFYVSKSYDPKAKRHADTVQAAIAFALSRRIAPNQLGHQE